MKTKSNIPYVYYDPEDNTLIVLERHKMTKKIWWGHVTAAFYQKDRLVNVYSEDAVLTRHSVDSCICLGKL
jgi:hypothetical protein